MAQYSEEWFYPTGALATEQRAIVFGPGDNNVVAPIFSDPAMTVPLANPTTTDALGMLTFYAPDGTYWIWVGPTTGGNGIEITLGASPDNPVLSVNGVAPDGGGNVELTAADVDAQPITTIDAAGDLYVGTGNNATTRLPIGSAGEVLTVVAGTASWEPGGGGGAVDSVNGQTGVVVLGASDVGAQPIATINAAGDLYVGTANDATTRLPIGAPGEVLTVVAGTASWEPVPADAVTSVNGQTGVVVLDATDVSADPAGSAAAAAAASQPLATIDATGDLYIGTGNNTTTRLPIGSPGEVLTVVAGTASWEAAPADAVTSVNGQTGVVVLDAGDVGADVAGAAAAAQAAAEAASQPLATIDALGDLYVGTGANTTTRLPRGANGEVLATNDAEPGGLEWIPAPGGAVDSVNGQTGVVVLDASDVGAVATVGTSDIVYGTDDAGAQTTYNVEGLTDDTIVFTDDRNVLTAGNGDARFYNRLGRDLIIVGAWVSVGVQPTGAAILVDVNVNGTTIYSTQANRPTVAISTNGGGISATPDTTAFAVGDYFTVDIDQIGSTIAGGRMTVGIVVRQNI